MYRFMLRLGLTFLAALLVACGSGTSGAYGNGGGNNPPPTTAAVQGVWFGSYTINGQSGSTPIIAAVAQGGYAFFYDEFGNIYVLPKLTGSTTLSGTLTAYATFGTTFPDGHSKEDFSLTGTASNTSITGTFSGNGETGSFALTPLVTQSTGVVDIADLAGNMQGFYFGSGSAAVALTVQSSGVFAGTDANGCNLVGTLTKIQSAPFLVAVTVKSSGSSGACAGDMTGLGFVTDEDIGNLFGNAAGNYLYVGVSSSQGAFAAELKF
ncbi:MAG TPA: hypothetical protein VHP13_04005 [Gammaproteobacteria bacterium]|nr:hypothetical protein [Gammaproteobacteria bacterium]